MIKYFFLGTFSKTLILIFINPLFFIFRNCMMDSCYNVFKENKINMNTDIRLIYVSLIYFGEILNGILSLIVYKKIKYIQKIVIKTPIKLDSQ